MATTNDERAGSRYPELRLTPSIMLTDDRTAASERLIGEHGWSGLRSEHLWAVASFLAGDRDQIAHDMVERRTRYGFSYETFSDHQVDAFASLVQRLRGVLCV